MSLKNTSFIDRHIEKVALGAGILVALAIAYFLAWDDPWKITLDDKAPPRSGPDAETKVANGLSLLRTKISPSTPSPITPPEVTDFHAKLEHGLDERVSPVPWLVSWALPGIQPTKDTGIETPLIPLPPPSPTAGAAGARWFLLDPEAAKQPEYTGIIGAQQPADFPMVSISAWFDTPLWEQALNSKNIRVDWTHDSLKIANVKLERQTFDPAKRTWSKWETIAPLPNYPVAKWRDPDLVTFKGTNELEVQDEIKSLVRDIGDQQFARQRAPLPPLAGGLPWYAPEVIAPRAGEPLDAFKKRRAQTMELDAQISELEKPAPVVEPPVGVPPQPGPALPPGVPGLPPGVPGLPPGVPGSAFGPGMRPMIVPPSVPAPSPEPAPEPGDTGVAAKLLPLKDAWYKLYPPPSPQLLRPPAAAPMRIVAHDMTAKPGNTYRYRVTVQVLNPYFGQRDLTVEAHNKYFNLLSFATEPSDATMPVTVPDPTQIFLTNAQAASGVATFEAYQFYAGKWAHASIPIARGKPLNGSITIGANTIPVLSGQSVVDVLVSDPPTDKQNQQVIMLDANNRLFVRNAAEDGDKLQRFTVEQGGAAAP